MSIDNIPRTEDQYEVDSWRRRVNEFVNENESDISSHNHDGRYYLKGEVDTLLTGKSNVGHNHDSSYSALGHTHDDRYYTETESDSLLNAKIDKTVLTTKGDLLGFSTVLARLGVGSNNQVLTADSAQSLGIKWATPATPATESFLGKMAFVYYYNTKTQNTELANGYDGTGNILNIVKAGKYIKVAYTASTGNWAGQQYTVVTVPNSSTVTVLTGSEASGDLVIVFKYE